MALNLENLEEVREGMLHELDRDISNHDEYYSNRLRDDAEQRYIELLRQAIINGNDSTLAHQIRIGALLKTQESYNRSGVTHYRAIPATAPETLAEGEFNRFYIRGACLRAIATGRRVMAYRAKRVMNPRPESEQIIGQVIDPNVLLNDLRTHQGEAPQTRMPGGPNSGISVSIV